MDHEKEPGGPPAAVQVVSAALPSRRHAEMLFELAVSEFGALARQETQNGGTSRRLFRVDPANPSDVIPWPILEFNTRGRFGVVTDWMPTGSGSRVMNPDPGSESLRAFRAGFGSRPHNPLAGSASPAATPADPSPRHTYAYQPSRTRNRVEPPSDDSTRVHHW